jgi:hypothetical protein
MVGFDPTFTEAIFLDIECHVPSEARRQSKGSLICNPVRTDYFVLGGVFRRGFPLQNKVEPPWQIWNWVMENERSGLQQVAAVLHNKTMVETAISHLANSSDESRATFLNGNNLLCSLRFSSEYSLSYFFDVNFQQYDRYDYGRGYRDYYECFLTDSGGQEIFAGSSKVGSSYGY